MKILLVSIRLLLRNIILSLLRSSQGVSYEKANLDRCFIISFGSEFCIRSQRIKKNAKKPELSSQLVAHKDKKDAKKPELSSQLVAHKDKKDAKKPKNSVA